MEKDLKIEELHRQFSEYGKNAKEWARRCILMLPDIARHQVWKRKGFGSISEYAGKVAGLSKYQVEEGLRVLRRVEDKPALRVVIEKKGINAVRPVVTIATQETAEFWAEKAGSMAKNELETYVRDFRNYANGSETRPRTDSQPEESLKPLTINLSSQMIQRLEKVKGQGTWEEAMEKLLQARGQQLDQAKPDPVQTSSQHIPDQMQNYIDERDGCTCAVPGCNKPSCEYHHVDGFSRTHVHDPDRIVSLCREHHQLAHRGLIENEHLSPQFWRVREMPDRASPRFVIDLMVQNHRQRDCLVL